MNFLNFSIFSAFLVFAIFASVLGCGTENPLDSEPVAEEVETASLADTAPMAPSNPAGVASAGTQDFYISASDYGSVFRVHCRPVSGTGSFVAGDKLEVVLLITEGGQTLSEDWESIEVHSASNKKSFTVIKSFADGAKVEAEITLFRGNTEIETETYTLIE